MTDIIDDVIDVNFDFQAEAGVDNKGVQRDSDKYSPTLQEYHRILWSKQLPNGKMFNLTKISNNRLHHKSEIGEFFLSSDRAIPTFSRWKRFQHIISLIPRDEVDKFNSLGDTIGGIVIWPSKQINGLPTMNMERGFNTEIVDRLDITIECIRLYYLGKKSPLYDTLNRYKDFFALFGSFKGYIVFFLLQDAVSKDYSSVKVAVPFDDFKSSPLPKDTDEYVQYMKAASEFVKSRNKRIAKLY